MAKGICSVETCNEIHYARGWCERHYVRWRRHGDVAAHVPLKTKQKRDGACQIADCERPIYGRRLCLQHWRRDNKHGDPLADVPIRQFTDGRCSVSGCPREHDGLGWCSAHYQLWKQYKLTPEDYDVRLRLQGGGCAICGEPPTAHARLHVDHDHACCPARKRSCGKCVRGLLCSPCNTMLGHAQDSPDRLRAAIRYLGQLA